MPDVIQLGIRKPRTNHLKTAPVTVGTQPNGDIGIAGGGRRNDAVDWRRADPNLP
jgi:hypothetical protein